MIFIRTMCDHAVTFGSVTLHLQEYRITGGCLLHEQGTADGVSAVAAVYPKGTRIIMKGKLAPPCFNVAQAAAALDAALRGGITRAVQLDALQCTGMRLIGYTLGTQEAAADVTLIFYTQSPLTAVEPQ
ncbi:MAG: hypothetical protein K6F80_00170 [Oscillospiraceae bacterium]|nr:hypothetical protein [Oscillospiraceae bacterium]